MEKLRNISLLFTVFMATLMSACTLDDLSDFDSEDPRDKFLGTWNVAESCTRQNYEVIIKYDPSNSAQVLLENFGNPGPGYPAAEGLVVQDRIYIDNQVIGDNWIVNGQGNVNKNELFWVFELKLSGTVMNCTATYAKQ